MQMKIRPRLTARPPSPGGATRTSAARVTARPGPNAVTTFLFFGYIVLLAFEWLGLQAEIPALKAMRFTTILGYLLLVGVITQIGIRETLRSPQAKILIGFVVFSTASMLWAVVTLHAYNAVRPFVDYTTFFVLTAALVDRATRVKALAWTLLLVCVVLFSRNIDKLGGTTRIGGFKAGYFLGDGNDLAWGMTIALPLIGYLLLVERGLLSRLAAIAAIGICLLVVVGTGSRGGTLALGVSLLFYILYVSRRRLLGVLGVGLVATGVLLLAPGGYFDRMKTIGEYQQDSSAQTRLMMWRAAANMAIDFPLGVGAGNFASAYGRYYSPQRNSDARVDEVIWAPTRWLNAHSIYFKTLGEYGFVGVFMLLGLIAINIRDSLAARARLLSASSPTAISSYWPALVAMSVCGFAVGGIFLGGLAYPHMFFLSGLVVANTRLVRGIARSADDRTAVEPSVARRVRGPGTVQR